MRAKLTMGIILVILAAAATGGWLFYTQSQFRLVSTIPQKDAGSVAPVIFKFNRDLDRQTANYFTITPAVQGTIQISGGSFTFQPAGNYTLNTTYTAKLSQVVATDGSTLGDQSVTFTVKLLQFNQLSPSEQQAQKDRTDVVERTNPFLAQLPYSTTDFKIDYQLISTDSRDTTPTNVTYTITLYAVLNQPDQIDTYNAELKTYKQEALNWIRSQGTDPNALKIQYSPDVPN